MWQRIYIERKIKDHPRAREIVRYFEDMPLVDIENYGEVFFRKKQNFFLQKKFPSLVIAQKENLRVQKMPSFCPAPRQEKYYFSPILGCLADCQYCYLRGHLPSAYLVVFINYEDFFRDLPKGKIFVSTAFESDSLSLEKVFRFIPVAREYAQRNSHQLIELRTKLADLSNLPLNPPANLILSFTISDHKTWQNHEPGTAAPAERLKAAKEAQRLGWQIAFHFDPLFEESLPKEILKKFDGLAYHTIGKLRLPPGTQKQMRQKALGEYG